ncbi:hypothetical protein E2C01_033604 [Portunus trituberculatus]|uniref:Uncharacterized protein n=1 Tax=Portunus trituberculatus TaxID=210409 RepID=A0A5B7EZ33_PORTR|nr:hypothetical protein [Portunus trituberculatus]
MFVFIAVILFCTEPEDVESFAGMAAERHDGLRRHAVLYADGESIVEVDGADHLTEGAVVLWFQDDAAASLRTPENSG